MTISYTKNDLFTWIFKHRDSIDFNLIAYEWPIDFPVSVYDFETKLKVEGEVCLGRGRSLDKDTALLKAISECIERYFVMTSEAPNSNGFAAHTSLESAQNAAILELIERDLFLCHFLTFSKFSDISNEIELKYPQHLFTKTRHYFKEKKIDIYALQLSNNPSYFATACIAFGEFFSRPFGTILGLGCDLTFEKSLDSSFFECITNVCALMNNQNLKYRNNNHCNDPIEQHRNSALEITSTTFFRSTITETSKPPFIDDFQKIINSTSFKNFTPPTTIMDIPVFVVQASNPNLQSLYFGDSKIELLNTDRLNQFLGRSLSINEINFSIHPIT